MATATAARARCWSTVPSVNACLVLALEAPGPHRHHRRRALPGRRIRSSRHLSSMAEPNAGSAHPASRCAKALLDHNPDPTTRMCATPLPEPLSLYRLRQDRRRHHGRRGRAAGRQRPASWTPGSRAPGPTALCNRSGAAAARRRQGARHRQRRYPAISTGRAWRMASCCAARTRTPHPPHRHGARARRCRARRPPSPPPTSPNCRSAPACPLARPATTCGWSRRSTWRAARCSGSASRSPPSLPWMCTWPRPRWR